MGGAAQLGIDSSELFTNEDLDDYADEKEDSDEKKPKRWTLIVFICSCLLTGLRIQIRVNPHYFRKLDPDPH